MKRCNKKRGFTIVELVIVIAVIAILAAVLIPTFSGVIKKSKISNDKSLVKNLNTILASEKITEKENGYAHDAVVDAIDNGYSVEKLSPTAEKHEILWDSVNDRFVLTSGDKIVYPGSGTITNKVDYFKFYDEVPALEEQTYSIYLKEGVEVEAVNVKVGLDVGVNDSIDVNYTGASNVIINTNGGKLTVNNAAATVNHYGQSNYVNIEAVAPYSYHEYGTAEVVKVKSGRFVAEETGIAKKVVVPVEATTVKIEAVGTIQELQKPTSVEVSVEGEVETVVEANVNDANVEDAVVSALDFKGGMGTEQHPFLIESKAQLEKIADYYTKGFNCFKMADSWKGENFDASNMSIINLNGSFDGNGVKFVNLTYALFKNVGYQNQNRNIVLKNFDATMNTTAGTGVVRNIFNSGTTTFENVNVHGYIEGQYNIGSFYNYGTANCGDAEAASYTVKFVNSKSDATIVNTTGNVSGGMFGHGYEGSGNVLSVYMDANSSYTGKMYTVGGKTCGKIMAMCSNGNFKLNGQEISRYDSQFNYASTSLTVVAPEAGNDGYTIEKVAGATKVVAMLNVQLTAYDAEGNKITNSSGLTWNVAKWDVNGTNVFGKVDSANLVNNAADDCSYTLDNGVLTIKTGSGMNYLDGTITLQVNQYDAQGNVLACGSVTVYNITK